MSMTNAALAGDFPINSTTSGDYCNVHGFGCVGNCSWPTNWSYTYWPAPIDYDLLSRKVADLVLDEIQPKRAKLTRDKLRGKLQKLLEELDG